MLESPLGARRPIRARGRSARKRRDKNKADACGAAPSQDEAVGPFGSDRRREYFPTDREKLRSLRDERLVDSCVCAPVHRAWQQLTGGKQTADGLRVNFLQPANTNQTQTR